MKHQGKYATRDELIRFGPCALASFTPTQADAALMANPTACTGGILVDTGATQTCIHPDIPAQLGLPMCGMTRVVGVHGTPGVVPVYRLSVVLGVMGKGGKGQVRFEQNMAATPLTMDLHPEHVANLNNGGGWGGNHNAKIAGLLGRDFLSNCMLRYQGREGRFTLEFAEPNGAMDKLKKERQAKRAKKNRRRNR